MSPSFLSSAIRKGTEIAVGADNQSGYAQQTHYAVLGVASAAGVAEIRRAFRKLALRHHPDRAGPDSTELFQRIALAYEVLSDPIARSVYDARLAERHGAPGTRAGSSAGVDGVDDLIARLAGSLESLIARGAARRTTDGTIELLLTADEVARGGAAAVGVRLQVPCPTCGGCAQAGSIWCVRCEFAGTVPDEVTACIAFPAEVADGATFSVRFDDLADEAPPLRVRVRRA
jgi:DnaJ-class molecular chaperone